MHLFFILLLALTPLFSEAVLVSVSPYKKIAQELLGKEAHVTTIVPPGASMHHFEPSPRLMQESAKADLWIRIGEPFETAAMRSLLKLNPNMVVLDLRIGMPLLAGKESGCIHCSGGADLHFWLDPILLKMQSEKIAAALMLLYPHQKEEIEKNLHSLLVKLDALDAAVREKLAPLEFRTFLVNHPAYAYFAKRYALSQLSLEEEGHDPTPRHLTEVIAFIKSHSIHQILIQKQYSSKGAELVARTLNLKLVTLDPYNEELFEEIQKTAEVISTP